MSNASLATKASPPASDISEPQPLRKRRGVNREGLEAGKRSTRTILWILLAVAMVLYGFPFLYLLF
ncbi:carbohydrate ABC transporter permease, partial [Paenarthrobacter sp. CM16]|nr:carbohydrate ABC transporter permease [Paenarthrobacter sp. CM16]